MRVAIVGNGVSHNKGPLIDAHDSVVRINSYVIEGHEVDVGSKQDIICIRPSLEPPAAVDACSEIWIPWKLRMCMQHPNSRFKEWVTQFSEQKIFRIPDCSFWTPFLKEHRWGNNRYTTTGFVAVHYALFLGHEVSITGFDGAATGHYWEQHTHFNGHEWGYEWETLQRYARERRITIL